MKPGSLILIAHSCSGASSVAQNANDIDLCWDRPEVAEMSRIAAESGDVTTKDVGSISFVYADIPEERRGQNLAVALAQGVLDTAGRVHRNSVLHCFPVAALLSRTPNPLTL